MLLVDRIYPLLLSKMVSIAAMSLPAFVTFNVAGQRFTTHRDTLLKEPASRLALLARGVLSAVKDDSGAIFLDRDSKHFQLLLNYLRDGWCSLPVTAQERRELLQEVRFFQLSSMEAWLQAQEAAITLNEAALLPRPSSIPLDPFSRVSALSSCLSAPTSPLLTSPLPHAALGPQPPAAAAFTLTTAVAGGGGGSTSTSPSTSPFRGSFLAGPNQDLLAAGALASCGILSNSLSNNRPSTALLHAGSAGLLNPGLSPGALGSKVPMATAALGGLNDMVAGSMPSTGSPGSVSRLPLPLPSDGFKWTHRLLQTNPKMQEVVQTLLELAYLPPHTSLQAGKVTISCSSECSHELGAGRTSSLLMLGAQQQLEASRFRNQVLRVSSSLGWAFELAIRASSDVALHDKYNIAGFLQDNWFMVSAVLKEQYGLHMEEDLSTRPSCLACRRHNITLSLQKVY